MAKSKKRIHQMTNRQWEAAFPTEDACRTYLVACRWAKGVRCPRCGAEVGVHGTMAFNWQCYACADKGTSYRFSVLVGTVFENTKYPLREWFRVIHLMLTSKKGISALQIHRMIGTGSYRTAWSICHRVRAGLANEDFRKLMGIVEVDETFIGGNKWQPAEDCARHPVPGTYPVVITGQNEWGGWRVPGAEYDMDPARVEMQARLIASAPQLAAFAGGLVDWARKSGEDMPNALVELAHNAQDILAHVKGQ